MIALPLLLSSVLTITAGGDAFMVQKFPAGYSVDARLKDWIASGDVRLVNFEAVVNDGSCRPAAWSGGTWASMDPDVLPDLFAFGFNGYGCANNHSNDFSWDALTATMKALADRHAPFAGIGTCLQDATKPAYVDTPNGRVAFVSVCASFHPDAMAGLRTSRSPGRPGLNGLRFSDVFRVSAEQLEQLKRIASDTGINGNRELNQRTGFTAPDAPGTFVLGGTSFKVADPPGHGSSCNAKDLKRITGAIREAKRNAAAVVVLAHSHEMRMRNVEEPAEYFMEFCRAAVDAGADAVIGGGTHQLKGVEFRGGKPIFYSLGDFVFQNSVVPLVPPDFCEQYGVAPDADAKTAFGARSKGGKVGLHAYRENFLSVVPKIEVENGKVLRVTLLPIELHFGRDWDVNGLPRSADAEATGVILKALERTSAEFGTAFRLREDGLIEAVPPRPGIDRAFLREMIAIPSETPDQTECNRATDAMRGWLEKRGVVCNVITNGVGRRFLYAGTTPGLEHDYVFVTHLDVVPAIDKSQYTPVIEGDLIRGRGACDTKGNAVMIAEVLARSVGRASVGAVYSTDEEGGSGWTYGCADYAVRCGVKPRKMVLVGDSAGEAPGQLFDGEKGHLRITLTAKGKGGHSSIPWACDNPIPKLMEAYSKILEAFPNTATAEDNWHDVISATVISGSEAGNVIPDEAKMTLSYRYVTPGDDVRMVEKLKKLTGLEVTFPVRHLKPVVNREGDPEIERLFAAMKAKWPNKNVRKAKMSAATDAWYFNGFHLPTVIFAADAWGAHAVDERGSLSALDDYADLMTAFVTEKNREQ